MKFFNLIKAYLNGCHEHGRSVEQEADALILEVSTTGFSRNGRQEVHFLLQITPRNSRNHIVECRQLLTELELTRLSIGTRMKIQYNPKKPAQVRWPKTAV